MVIETGHTTAEVARDLGMHDGTLGNWINAWRRANPDPEQRALIPAPHGGGLVGGKQPRRCFGQDPRAGLADPALLPRVQRRGQPLCEVQGQGDLDPAAVREQDRAREISSTA